LLTKESSMLLSSKVPSYELLEKNFKISVSWLYLHILSANNMPLLPIHKEIYHSEQQKCLPGCQKEIDFYSGL